MAQQTYQQRTRARLDGLRVQLERLRDDIFERPERFNMEERRRLESLRDLYHRARRHFETVHRADDWRELRPEMDRLLDGLQTGLEEARGEQQART